MKILSTWIKSEPAQKLFGYGIAGLMWLFHLTVRWERRIDPETRALLDAGKPMILCMWHGRMFFLSGGWPKPPKLMGVVASGHRDGQLIARGARAFGYETIAGSSRRGGATALRGMSRLLKQGTTVVITPDGPKGPRMRFKSGAVKAAQMTGAPLVALTGSARPRKLFRTWDRFCLPLPFARAVIHFGPPITVPREADAETLERCRRTAEDCLNSLTNEAERALGQEEIEAAAPEVAAGKAEDRHASA
ncbi:lysophospholipid acyltransferase family protein [Pelagibius sp. CAU 1746]|uniref:lysophospholipid acyltransferase family protein n=1 Tax=Pelagibius sp. CAU 1746 TaxID=3140370 RepID=UPI00325B9218